MRRTLRLRLAVLCTAGFLASGALLLGLVVALFTGKSTREAAPAPGGQVTGGGSSADVQQGADLHLLLISCAIGLAVTVVVALVLGWIIAGRALRPLRTMVSTARAISASTLHSRIGLRSPYLEIMELGSTLDDLFSRLDAAFQAQRHFVANASHELRTPLTAERALLQVTLADPDADTATLRSACQEVLHLGAAQERLVESLLTLATSEQGVEHFEPLDLGAITAEAVLLRRPEAERRDVGVDVTLTRAPAVGDPHLIESLVANLVDNAIRHNVPGGRVEVTTSRSADGAHLTVRNTGPVVPPEELDRLFVPFQRLHAERTRLREGHGLGLAIVRAIVTAHDGVLTSHAPESGGLDLRVDLPVRGPAQPGPSVPGRTGRGAGRVKPSFRKRAAHSDIV
ncbi:sensor histidine kinase [Streptomyces sp. NPDC001443]